MVMPESECSEAPDFGGVRIAFAGTRSGMYLDEAGIAGLKAGAFPAGIVITKSKQI